MSPFNFEGRDRLLTSRDLDEMADPTSDMGVAFNAAVPPLIQDLIDNEELLPSAVANATYAGKNVPQGVAGREYSLILGTIRNNGSPNYFQTLEDSAHRSTGIASVTTLTDRVRVTYTDAATKVASFIAVPDEKLASLGFTCGTSTGTTYTDIFVYRQEHEYADYVSYNGSSWVSLNGIFTPSFSAGTLTLTHAYFDSAVPAFTASAVSRGGTYVVNCDAAATNYMTVQFRDWTGALITTADTNMKVYARQGGGPRQLFNPQLLTNASYGDSNIWLFGSMEV